MSTTTTTTTERTWRMQVFTTRGSDYSVEFMRERVKDFGDGDIIEIPCGVVTRKLSRVRDQSIPGGPRSVNTIGDVVALIAELGHVLAAEDQAAAVAAAAALARGDQA